MVYNKRKVMAWYTVQKISVYMDESVTMNQRQQSSRIKQNGGREKDLWECEAHTKMINKFEEEPEGLISNFFFVQFE